MALTRGRRMTDKQIIIDDQKKTIHRLQDECTEKTNAIIALGEQLKAKEQECERLRFPMQDTNYAILAKEEFEEYKKLKQTFTEIKEIAEKCCINQAILDCENYDDCTQCGRISDGEGIQQILQKISECE